MNLEQEFKEYTEWADKTFPNFQEVAPDDAMFQSWLEGKRRALNQSPWVSVEDRLPELGEYVLIKTVTGVYQAQLDHRENDDRISIGDECDLIFLIHYDVLDIDLEDVTHWMPIPNIKE